MSVENDSTNTKKTVTSLIRRKVQQSEGFTLRIPLINMHPQRQAIIYYANQSLQRFWKYNGVKVQWRRMICGSDASVILTSLRAFSNFGLLSSTLSLDCCFNFRSIAVTEETRMRKKTTQLTSCTKYIQSLKVRGLLSYIARFATLKSQNGLFVWCIYIYKHIFANTF